MATKLSFTLSDADANRIARIERTPRNHAFQPAFVADADGNRVANPYLDGADIRGASISFQGEADRPNVNALVEKLRAKGYEGQPSEKAYEDGGFFVFISKRPSLAEVTADDLDALPI